MDAISTHTTKSVEKVTERSRFTARGALQNCRSPVHVTNWTQIRFAKSAKRLVSNGPISPDRKTARNHMYQYPYPQPVAAVIRICVNDENRRAFVGEVAGETEGQVSGGEATVEVTAN